MKKNTLSSLYRSQETNPNTLKYQTSGYTLVELIITIAILSILTAIGASYYFYSYTPNARDATRQANLKSVYDAMDIYQQNGQIDQLPKPANAISILSGSTELGYQGELEENMASLFDVSREALFDPDSTPYLYRFDQKRRKFSLMAFLEGNPGDAYQGLPLALGVTNTYAASTPRSERYPFIIGDLEFVLKKADKSPALANNAVGFDYALLTPSEKSSYSLYRDIHNIPPQAKCAPGPRITPDEGGIGSPLCTRGSTVEYNFDVTYGWRWKCQMEQSATNCSAILPAGCSESSEVFFEAPSSSTEACSVGGLVANSVANTQSGYTWQCQHTIPNNTTNCQAYGRPICGSLVGSSVSGATVSTFSGSSACSKGSVLSGSVRNNNAWWEWVCDSRPELSALETQSTCYTHNAGLVYWARSETGATLSGANFMWQNLVGPHKIFSQNTGTTPSLNTTNNLSLNNFHPAVIFNGTNELRGAENIASHISNSNTRGQWGTYNLHSNTTPFSYIAIARDEISPSLIGNYRAPIGFGTQCSYPGVILQTSSTSPAGLMPLYNGSFIPSQTAELANSNRGGIGTRTQMFRISSLNASTGSLANMSIDGSSENLFSTARQTSLGKALCIGGSYGSRWTGPVMETMVYASDIVSSGAIQNIQSYLALKYGITLDQKISTNLNYKFASAAPFSVWSSDAIGRFDENIAGLGRDDSFPFYQKQARSANTGLQPIISITSLAASNSSHTGTIAVGRFLTWSSDNGNTKFSMPANGIGGFDSFFERRWKLQKTDWVQGVSIYWRESEFDSLALSGSISLAVSNNPEFSGLTANVALVREQIDGNWYRVAKNVFFPNDDNYLTLAKTSSATLPIQKPTAWVRADTALANIGNGSGITTFGDRYSSFTLGLFPNGAGNGSNSVNDGYYSSSVSARPKYHSTTLGKLINFNPSLEFSSGSNALQINSRIHPIGQSFFYFVVARDDMSASERSSNHRVAPAGFGSSAGQSCNYPVMNFHNNSTLPYSSYNKYGPAIVGSTPASWSASKGYTFNSRTAGSAFAYPRAQIFALGSLNPQVGFDNVVSLIDGHKEQTDIEADASNANIGSALCVGTSGNGPGSNWRGVVSEVLAYTGTLTSRDLQRINSYLAIKYSIPLDTRQDDNKVLISSIGTLLYESPSGYTGSVAGIGRDDNFELVQRQSQASSNTGNIIIGLSGISDANHLNPGNFSTDQTFVIWSDNGLTGINRTWRIQTYGTIPGSEIAYPQSLSSGSPTLRLSQTPDFSGPLITLAAPSIRNIGGVNYWVTTLPLSASSVHYLKKY